MLNRRVFLQASAASAAALPAVAREEVGRPDLHLSAFKFDVTPPMGHSLCGGWIKPVVGYDDPLDGIGLVLQGAGKPVVICVLDWTGLMNAGHIAFRQALAEAAGTTADRVTIHCVHPHNAPFACLDAESIVERHEELPHIVERDFFQKCLDRGREAVRDCLGKAQRVTHVARGMGRVEKVASNRRLLGPDGKVRSQRGSSSKSPEHQQAPEGLIDPMLRTVAFYSGKDKIAACHYYACHPMSYYGDGRVSADFCGLARRQRQQDEPRCAHLYFNGCGGNIGAGKYNDGSKEMRPVLTKRILEGIVRSEAELKPEPVDSVRWSTHPILPPPNPTLDAEAIEKQIADAKQRVVARNRPAYSLAWIRRYQRKEPILLGGLSINDIEMLHLPAECFVEYQLRAQQLGGERFVAVAAYGDGGPWYIPVKEAYPQGGYAVSVAWCDAQIDSLLTAGLKHLLS